MSKLCRMPIILAHCAALGLAVFARAAPAQDVLRFSPEAVESCLAEAPPLPTEQAACIGRAANDCMTHPRGANTAVIAFCLGQEAQFWDARLNKAYAALLPDEAAHDAERGDGWSLPRRAEALRHMQRDWTRFRDSACQYNRLRYDTGSLANSAQLACLMRLTARQALDLEAFLEEMR